MSFDNQYVYYVGVFGTKENPYFEVYRVNNESDTYHFRSKNELGESCWAEGGWDKWSEKARDFRGVKLVELSF